MRIAIDCRKILDPKNYERAGVGHYVYYLAKCLAKENKEHEIIILVGDKKIKEKIRTEFDLDSNNRVKIKSLPLSWARKFLPFVYSHIIVSLYLYLLRLDLYHNLVTALPLFYFGRSIITVHDLAIFIHPEWFPGGQWFSRKILVPMSLRRAEKVIAISQNTKKDIVKIFGLAENKITVVYPGAEETFGIEPASLEYLKSKFGLSDKYILFLGTIEPRKNIKALIAAFKSIIMNHRELASGLELIIAGAKGWKYEEIFLMMSDINLENKVKYIGYVTPEEKYGLIKNALVFVFPRLYEGFGLPVLEAMKIGTPVISSNTSSIPEVAGDGAILVDPCHEEEFKAKLVKVISDEELRKRIGRAGQERAKEFTWDRCAKEILKIY